MRFEFSGRRPFLLYSGRQEEHFHIRNFKNRVGGQAQDVPFNQSMDRSNDRRSNPTTTISTHYLIRIQLSMNMQQNFTQMLETEIHNTRKFKSILLQWRIGIVRLPPAHFHHCRLINIPLRCRRQSFPKMIGNIPKHMAPFLPKKGVVMENFLHKRQRTLMGRFHFQCRQTAVETGDKVVQRVRDGH